MSLADRATIANMAPEYGATMGFFPVDVETLNYLRRTGRTKAEVELVERYTKEQGLFRTDTTPPLQYTKTVSLDLSTVEPSLAGPKRPQDRVSLASMQKNWRAGLKAPVAERGFALDEDQAMAALRDWNARCQPPWRESELRDKVRRARRYGREAVGGLV